MDTIMVHFKGDEKFIQEKRARLKNYSDKELLDYYHSVTKNGLFGVRAQSLTVLAIHQECKERFGVTPVEYKNGLLKDRAIQDKEE